MGKLDGRVALVTGGQRGLGAATLKEMAAEGASCVVNYPDAMEEEAARVTVELPLALFTSEDRAGIKRCFDEVHAQRYGFSSLAENAEIVSLRSAVSGIMSKPPFETIETGTAQAPASGGIGSSTGSPLQHFTGSIIWQIEIRKIIIMSVNLANIDLKLLVVFDAVMTERRRADVSHKNHGMKR